MTTTPTHLLPDSCYVCGGRPHADQPITPTSGHNYWPNADAAAYFRREDARHQPAETPEARYVRQHRPY